MNFTTQRDLIYLCGWCRLWIGEWCERGQVLLSYNDYSEDIFLCNGEGGKWQYGLYFDNDIPKSGSENFYDLYNSYSKNSIYQQNSDSKNFMDFPIKSNFETTIPANCK